MTEKQPPFIYWDACVFIDALQKTKGRIDDIGKVIKFAEQGNVKIITSAVTLVEVCKLKKGAPVSPEDEQHIQEFFMHEYFMVRSVDSILATNARKIAQEFNLKACDAIHVATALAYKAVSLHTYDGNHLLPLNGKIGDPALDIENPCIPGEKFDLLEKGVEDERKDTKK